MYFPGKGNYCDKIELFNKKLPFIKINLNISDNSSIDHTRILIMYRVWQKKNIMINKTTGYPEAKCNK